MGMILAKHFFHRDCGNIPSRLPDDPPPQESRTFKLFLEDELLWYLKDTSNTSVPGQSGVSWEIIKLAWGSDLQHIALALNHCILLRHHPQAWKEALVVVIPKPNLADYMVAKSYHPISLLEVLSKLLEKGVSKCLLHNINALPSSQQTCGVVTTPPCIRFWKQTLRMISSAFKNLGFPEL